MLNADGTISAQASDATLLRIARKLAEHDGEITTIMRDLQKERAQQRKLKREVKVNRAAVVSGRTVVAGRITGTATGLRAGAVSIRSGKFSIKPRAIVGAGPLVGIGIAATVGSMLTEWREMRAVRDTYGAGEALGRMGRNRLRSTVGGLIEWLGTLGAEIAGATVDDFDVESGIAAIRRGIRERIPLLKETKWERAERLHNATMAADAFIDEQFLQPINQHVRQISAVVRTSRESAALRKHAFAMNAQNIEDGRKAVYRHVAED